MPGKGTSLQEELDFLRPLQIRWLSLGQEFRNRLISDPSLIYTLSPEQFEELICERLFAMGLDPRRIGNTNKKDGGIDIIFWPRNRGQFPFLGAAQVKHHHSRRIKEKPSTVRDFVGSLARQPFNTGLIVTNTSFSADAQWYAEKHANLVRLRDISDIQR
jgi:restriction endonuclease Mrr